MAAKLYATVNSAEGPVTLERATPSAPWSPSGEAAADLVRTGPSTFSLVRNGRSHRVLVLKEDKENKIVRLRIGAHTFTVHVQDERSRLVKSLGLDKASMRVTEIKAPMPGLILEVAVKPGDSVSKGDKLVILEAMKMENVLKAPPDLTVKSVKIKKGENVEKAHILIVFE